jgi:hypothetical protein
MLTLVEKHTDVRHDARARAKHSFRALGASDPWSSNPFASSGYHRWWNMQNRSHLAG